MKATIYKELSNKQTPIELQAGLTVQEALPDLDLENAIIVINGRIENCNYVLQENDKVTIRLTPSGMELLIVGGILLAFGGIIGGVLVGNAIYNTKREAEKAKAELEKMKKLSNRPEVDNRPFLRGASNTIATGANQPYIIGRHFFTPYLLSQPFYEITGADGIDQYIYTVLECGFNKQVLKKIAIDDVTIKTFTDTAPQEGGYDLDTGIFAEGGKIEIAQGGELLSEIPALNYKVDSKTCNDQIPHDSEVAEGKKEYLTYTLNPYAMNVDIAITFPYGLYAFDDKGDKIETQLTITPQYSLDGGSSWDDFTFNNNGVQTNLFKRNISTQELRYVAHKDFSAEHYQALKANNQTAIYIRVRSNGNKDSAIKNDCYCLFHQSKCFDPDKSTDTELVPCKIIEDRERAFCTILGLKLKASKINEDKLKKINVITQGIARTWTGAKWSEEKSETRNPAAWALEIETSDSHPASRYNDDELDLESFGEFYEYCEDKGYKFDWVITQNVKKDDTLNHIMEATGACIYMDIYGRRSIAIDKPQENALAVYNPQNIISIQNKKTFSRRTDGLRIKYVNSKDDLYQEDTYLLMREVNGKPLEITPDSIIKDINITGITTFEHIVKHARRLMAIEALRPKTTIIEVGNEGVFYTPYSKILIQDDSLKIGIGKGYTIASVEWEGLLLKKIYTNEPLTLEATETYGIIVNCFTEKGVYPLPIKVAGDGETNELLVLTEIKAGSYARPDKGNVFSLGEIGMDGEFTKVSTPYIISQIKRSDKGFNLELVNYNEAIYESGTIPDYKSNITQRKSTIKKSIPPNLNAKDGKDGSAKFLPSLTVQGDYENQIGTYQGQLYRWTNSKWELLNAVMPVNPICAYDFADIYNQEKVVYTIDKPIIVKKNSIINDVRIHEAHKKATYYHIHCEAAYTGEAAPFIYVYRSDWASDYIVLNTFIKRKQDFYFFIPEQDFNFYVGIWMHGSISYIPKPDDSVTLYKFTVTEITNSTLIDSSGNKNHMEFVRGTTLFSKRLGTINGASFERNTCTQCKNPLKETTVWSISMWVSPKCIKNKFHHFFSINNFKPLIYNYRFYSYPAEHFLGILEQGKLYHLVFTVSEDETRIYLNTHLLKRFETLEMESDELFILGSWKHNYGLYNGFMGQVLLFDSLLTEQEILWLYLNPQYPVKNYTLADWSISPDNPDNVVASQTPQYLGVVETVPSTRTATITKGERLGAVDANPGDWVLSGKTIGGWKVGICYRWSGLAWKPLEPEVNYAEDYQACLLHMFQIEELKQQTGHYGALFAKVLVAQKALIDELLVNQAFIKNLVVQKLRIDSVDGTHQDFEAWFDETNGLKIQNNGEEIFRVDTNGDIFAKNVTMTDGYFSGQLNTPTLKLLKKTPETPPFSFTNGQTARDMFNSIGQRNSSTATGSFKGRQIVKISSGEKIKIITDWRSWNRYMGRWEYLKCEEDYYYVHIFTNNGTFEYGTFKYGSYNSRPAGYLNPTYAGNTPEYCGNLSTNKLDENISFSFTGNFATFMLSNIPTAQPNEDGIVWVDTQGYLRLKL